jgi:hypothetical protein
MSKATVARILQNLEFPSGTPYSSVAQILDAAMAAIAPYRELAQDAVAEIAHKMLEWSAFRKSDMYGRGTTKSTFGQEYTMKADEFDPDKLDIVVTLTPYLPVDEVAKINAAILGNKNLKMPLGRLLEDIGYEDSDAAIKEWEQERQDETAVQLDIQQSQLAMQAQIQQQAQMQQMAMQAQMEQQMQAQAAANQPPPNQGMENAGGLGFNPAQGGTPPVQMEEGIGRRAGRPEAEAGLK